MRILPPVLLAAFASLPTQNLAAQAPDAKDETRSVRVIRAIDGPTIRRSAATTTERPQLGREALLREIRQIVREEVRAALRADQATRRRGDDNPVLRRILGQIEGRDHGGHLETVELLLPGAEAVEATEVHEHRDHGEHGEHGSHEENSGTAESAPRIQFRARGAVPHAVGRWTLDSGAGATEKAAEEAKKRADEAKRLRDTRVHLQQLKERLDAIGEELPRRGGEGTREQLVELRRSLDTMRDSLEEMRRRVESQKQEATTTTRERAPVMWLTPATAPTPSSQPTRAVRRTR